MAAFMLESLVLRGSVLVGELAVVLHNGSSVKAELQAPGIDNSTRNPLHSGYQPTTPADPDAPTSGVMPGAGRSRRWFGSSAFAGSSRTALATTAWLRAQGGPAAAAVATGLVIPAAVATPAGEGNPTRLAGLLGEKKES